MLLNETDQDAMRRALATVRQRGGSDCEIVERRLATETWERAGEYAVYDCQDTVLRLKPWQPPPCWIRTEQDLAWALAQPYGVDGWRSAGELVRRLLAAGLSRYEPDPESALERIERAA